MIHLIPLSVSLQYSFLSLFYAFKRNFYFLQGLVPYTSLQSSAHQKSFKIAKSVTDSVPKQEIDEKAKGEAVDSSIDPDISVQRPVSISPRPAGSPLAPHPPAVYSIFSEDDEEEDQVWLRGTVVYLSRYML